MIKIEDKSKCCGCAACVQKCPKQCISMQLDDEGFYYPVADESVCIECGLCEKVCPELDRPMDREPIKCYAAKGRDDIIVEQSSSAGIFTLLAENVIKSGGVVFGARFDKNWDVEHAYTDVINGIGQFRSSKYVQSRIGNTYTVAKVFLDQGRIVMYTGTPCQLAGLHKYLRRDYDNLISVDVICHGVPSPGIWRDYLRNAISPFGRKNSVSSFRYSPLSERDATQIKGISFRDKRLGWKKFSFVLQTSQGYSRSEENTVSSSYKPLIQERHYRNLFLQGFLSNIILRQSCYSCPARKGRSGSDLLLGDYWGVKNFYPEFYSREGVSMALAYSEKGKKLIEKLDLDIIEISYNDTKGNSNIEYDVSTPEARTPFFIEYRERGINALVDYCKRAQKHPLLVLYKNIIDHIKMLLK